MDFLRGIRKVEDELLAGEHVNAYYLEYDTDRAGDFKPLLRKLGMRKSGSWSFNFKICRLRRQEMKSSLVLRSKPICSTRNLYLSTQCGFASTEEGNVFKEEDQWKKIALISRIAREGLGRITSHYKTNKKAVGRITFEPQPSPFRKEVSL